MQIKTEVVNDVQPKSLAEALAKSTPKDFAAFWFYFSEFMDKHDKGDKKILEFAESLAPSFGGLRKQSLIKLCDLMKYYETKEILQGED